MSLTRIGTRKMSTAPSSTQIAEIVRLMDENDVGSVVIVRGSKPIGIITDRDIVLRVVRKGSNPHNVQVGDVMSSELASISDSSTPIRAAELMRERQIRRLPLVDANGDLVGIVTLDDLLFHIGREIGELSEVLAPFPVAHLGG